MTAAEILESLRENYEDVLLADGFEDALIGVVEGWFDHSHHAVACYDYDKCVRILMERDGMDEECAQEWMDFNVTDAYVGEYTPVFLHDWRGVSMAREE